MSIYGVNMDVILARPNSHVVTMFYTVQNTSFRGAKLVHIGRPFKGLYASFEGPE